MRTRQTVKHEVDCPAMKLVDAKVGTWNTPWDYDPKDGTVRRDSLGRKTQGLGEPWLVLMCNCSQCDGTMLVALDDIYAGVPHGLRDGT